MPLVAAVGCRVAVAVAVAAVVFCFFVLFFLFDCRVSTPVL